MRFGPRGLVGLVAVLACDEGGRGDPCATCEDDEACERTRCAALCVAATPPSVDDDEAVAKDDARFVAWASDWVRPEDFGSDLDPSWRDVELALGPPTGRWDDAVSLGNGGALTFLFDAPFGDHAGLDLALFENGFSPQFIELAFVEVSSDGRHFARFPSTSIQSEPVAAYGTVDPAEIAGVAGRYPGGAGTGFDLAVLAGCDAVVAGRVDLAAIRFVRVVDIVGDGGSRDSAGHPIYDPTPTFGPSGFDVEAVGVLGAR